MCMHVYVFVFRMFMYIYIYIYILIYQAATVETRTLGEILDSARVDGAEVIYIYIYIYVYIYTLYIYIYIREGLAANKSPGTSMTGFTPGIQGNLGLACYFQILQFRRAPHL